MRFSRLRFFIRSFSYFWEHAETRNRYEEDKATAYVRNLIEEMIADGRLTTAETRYGRGIRTTGAVKAPKKARQSR